MMAVRVDAHNDLLLELAHRRAEETPFARYWLANLERGGVRLQVCPLYAGLEHLPEGALRRALEQVAACFRAVRENPGRVMLVKTRDDLDAVEDNERLGLMLSMEGAEPFGYDPEMADVFWELGVRMFALTWNRRNAFAEGLAEPGAGGLSRLGNELVDRLVARGAILDLAHASEQTFLDVLGRADGASLVVSHASCRAVSDTPRNLSDGQLEALAERGGVVGIMAHPLVVDPDEPTIERVIDHLDHAVETVGIDHVGLGADFIRQVARSLAVQTPPDALLPAGMEMDATIEDLAGPEDYPNLVAALRERGYEGDRLDAVLGGNFVRIFQKALPDR
jgi:membrane dipeptidase